MNPRVRVESKSVSVSSISLGPPCLTGWVIFIKIAGVQEYKPKHASALQVLLVKASHMLTQCQSPSKSSISGRKNCKVPWKRVWILAVVNHGVNNSIYHICTDQASDRVKHLETPTAQFWLNPQSNVVEVWSNIQANFYLITVFFHFSNKWWIMNITVISRAINSSIPNRRLQLQLENEQQDSWRRNTTTNNKNLI